MTGQAYPDRPNTYVNSAKLRLRRTDSGCAGVKNIEYRQQGSTEWLPYSAEVTFDEGKTYTSSTARPTARTTSPRSRPPRSTS